MWIPNPTTCGLAVALGALAAAPAHATDLYIGGEAAPVYAPAPVYAAPVYRARPVYGAPVYPAPAPTYEAYPAGGYAVPAPGVVVREVPAEPVIVREAVPAGVYVRDVPLPPAPVGGYYDAGFPDDAYGGCQTVTRRTHSGHVVVVDDSCD